MLGKLFLLAFVIYNVDASEYGEGRILGGTNATVLISPIVSVQYYGKHVCAGVIQNATYVICPASCIIGLVEKRAITIRQGSDMHDSKGYIRYTSAWKTHENFQNRQNDIALVKARELLVTTPQYTIKALDTSPIYIVVGWGSTKVGDGALSPRLQQAPVQTVTKKVCKEQMGNLLIGDDAVCTENANKGPCQGDLGSPLVAAYNIFGIYTWNRSCTTGYSIFTDLSKHVEWINENINIMNQE